jgi:hypothetical protein
MFEGRSSGENAEKSCSGAPYVDQPRPGRVDEAHRIGVQDAAHGLAALLMAPVPRELMTHWE